MTAAEELRAAADTIRKLGREATPGPWHRPLNTRYKASIRAALPEGEQPNKWRDGIDPDTGERETVTVVTVPIWSNGEHARKRGGRDLEWIALAHPGLAEPLATWLEVMSGVAECDAERGFKTSAQTEAALAVARVILGRTPGEKP